MWIEEVRLAGAAGTDDGEKRTPLYADRVNVIVANDGESREAWLAAASHAVLAACDGDDAIRSGAPSILPAGHDAARWSRPSAEGRFTAWTSGFDSPSPDDPAGGRGATLRWLATGREASGLSGALHALRTAVAAAVRAESVRVARATARLRSGRVAAKGFGVEWSPLGVTVAEDGTIEIAAARSRTESRLESLRRGLDALRDGRSRAEADAAVADRLRAEAFSERTAADHLEAAADFAETRWIEAALAAVPEGPGDIASRLAALRARVAELDSMALPDRAAMASATPLLAARGSARADLDRANEDMKAFSGEPEPRDDPAGDRRAAEIRERLDRLAAIRTQTLAARDGLRASRARLDELAAGPSGGGGGAATATPSGLERMVGRVARYSPAERNAVRTGARELSEIAVNLAANREEADALAATVADCRRRREAGSGVAAASTALLAVGAVVGAVLAMAGLPTVGAAVGAAATGLCGLGLRHAGIGRAAVAEDLEPALARDLALSGESARLRERTETLRATGAVAPFLASLETDDLHLVDDALAAVEARAPVGAAREAASRAETALAAVDRQARDLAQSVMAQFGPTEPVPPAAEPADCLAELDTAEARLTRMAETEDSQTGRRRGHRAALTARNRAAEAVAAAESELEAMVAPWRNLAGSAFSDAADIHRRVESLLAEVVVVREDLARLEARGSETLEPALRERLAQLVAKSGADSRRHPGDRQAAATEESHEPLRDKAHASRARVTELSSRADAAMSRASEALERWRTGASAARADIAILARVALALRRHHDAALGAATILDSLSEGRVDPVVSLVAARVREILTAIDPQSATVDLDAMGTARVTVAGIEGTGRRQTSCPAVASRAAWAVHLAISELHGTWCVGHPAKASAEGAPTASSGGDTVPLILVEPFGLWDDTRAAAGYRALVGMAGTGRRQIIVLTGHAARLAEMERSDFETARELHVVRA